MDPVARSGFLRAKLTADALRFHAGERSYARGRKYQECGQVAGLQQRGDKIWGTVQGTEEYDVCITATPRSLDFDCSCPLGMDGAFCKHCVALGLEWLEQLHDGGLEENDAIPAYLNSLEKEELVLLLVDLSDADSELRQKLTLRAASASKNVADLKRLIDRTMKSRTYIDYYRMPAYARAARELIGQIEDMHSAGRSGEAIDLCETALRAAERTLLQCDDSDGRMGEIMARLQDIHLSACEACNPDPVKLARRLFGWEMTSSWDVFSGAAETYEAVLGDEGMEEYRRLVDSEWSGIPELVAGQEGTFESRRFRITEIKEAIARATNDFEGLVEIKRKDLSSPYRYLELAQLYANHDLRDQAVEWAKRGIEAFPSKYDSRLDTFLANQYENLGDDYASMESEWAVFCHAPGPRTYSDLKDRASRLDQWDLWRPKAFAEIRSAIAKRRAGLGGSYYADSSDMVSVLLLEGNEEGAWNEAKDGGCSAALWLRLAECREAISPEDSLGIYKRQVDLCVRAANNPSYEEAVCFVDKVRKLVSDQEFVHYVSDLRTRHKAKRNFMKLLAGYDL